MSAAPGWENEQITSDWIRRNAPGSLTKFGSLPRIVLPNGARDSGAWSLGIDRKHESTTVLLYCELGNDRRVYRRVAVIKTRGELIRLYEHFCGHGAWEFNRRKEARGKA